MKLCKKLASLALAATLGLTAFNASADSASYTTSGSAGNWTLNFTFTNDLGINNLDIYFVGVNVPGATNIGYPTGNWSNYSGFIYANEFLNYGVSIPDMIQNGESLSGFQVHTTALSAPSSVSWFAYHNDWTGSGANFQGNTNPVFFGEATVAAVPEPETYAMLLVGLGLLGAISRRKAQKTA